MNNSYNSNFVQNLYQNITCELKNFQKEVSNDSTNYQNEIVKKINLKYTKNDISNFHKTLDFYMKAFREKEKYIKVLCLPTGVGKTQMMIHIMSYFKYGIMTLSPTRELVKETYNGLDGLFWKKIIDYFGMYTLLGIDAYCKNTKVRTLKDEYNNEINLFTRVSNHKIICEHCQEADRFVKCGYLPLKKLINDSNVPCKLCENKKNECEKEHCRYNYYQCKEWYDKGNSLFATHKMFPYLNFYEKTKCLFIDEDFILSLQTQFKTNIDDIGEFRNYYSSIFENGKNPEEKMLFEKYILQLLDLIIDLYKSSKNTGIDEHNERKYRTKERHPKSFMNRKESIKLIKDIKIDSPEYHSFVEYIYNYNEEYKNYLRTKENQINEKFTKIEDVSRLCEEKYYFDMIDHKHVPKLTLLEIRGFIESFTYYVHYIGGIYGKDLNKTEKITKIKEKIDTNILFKKTKEIDIIEFIFKDFNTIEKLKDLILTRKSNNPFYTLIMSATINTEILKEYLDLDEKDICICKNENIFAQNSIIIQIDNKNNGNYGKNVLGKEIEGKWIFNNEKIKEIIIYISSLLKLKKERLFVVCKECFEKELSLLNDNIETEHYFNDKGTNSHRDCSVCICVGSAYLRDDENARSGLITKEEDVNPRTDADELIQGAGRIRSFARDGKLIIFIDKNEQVLERTFNKGKSYKMSLNEFYSIFSFESLNNFNTERNAQYVRNVLNFRDKSDSSLQFLENMNLLNMTINKNKSNRGEKLRIRTIESRLLERFVKLYVERSKPLKILRENYQELKNKISQLGFDKDFLIKEFKELDEFFEDTTKEEREFDLKNQFHSIIEKLKNLIKYNSEIRVYVQELIENFDSYWKIYAIIQENKEFIKNLFDYNNNPENDQKIPLLRKLVYDKEKGDIDPELATEKDIWGFCEYFGKSMKELESLGIFHNINENSISICEEPTYQQIMDCNEECV